MSDTTRTPTRVKKEKKAKPASTTTPKLSRLEKIARTQRNKKNRILRDQARKVRALVRREMRVLRRKQYHATILNEASKRGVTITALPTSATDRLIAAWCSNKHYARKNHQ